MQKIKYLVASAFLAVSLPALAMTPNSYADIKKLEKGNDIKIKAVATLSINSYFSGVADGYIMLMKNGNKWTAKHGDFDMPICIPDDFNFTGETIRTATDFALESAGEQKNKLPLTTFTLIGLGVMFPCFAK